MATALRGPVNSSSFPTGKETEHDDDNDNASLHTAKIRSDKSSPFPRATCARIATKDQTTLGTYLLPKKSVFICEICG
jgi:hypothetical protein